MDSVKPQKQIVVVCGLVTNDNDQVLLALRHQPDVPTAHNKWELPGGGVEFGETLQDCLKREMLEEIGVGVEIEDLIPFIYVGNWDFPEETVQAFVINYFCKISNGHELSYTANHEQEIADLRWFYPKDIVWEDCLPGLKEIFQAAKLV